MGVNLEPFDGFIIGGDLQRTGPAPLVFDYAEAAGYETAYWSSHHPMFANTRLFVQDLPTRFQCSATHLDPVADIDLGANDELLTERVKSELPLLR